MCVCDRPLQLEPATAVTLRTPRQQRCSLVGACYGMFLVPAPVRASASALLAFDPRFGLLVEKAEFHELFVGFVKF